MRGHIATVDRPSHVSVDVLDDVEGLLSAAFGAEANIASIIASARERASAVPAAGRSGEAARFAALAFVADVVTGVALERDWSCDEVAALIEGVAAVTRLRVEFVAAGVCLRALRDPRLLELPPRVGVEAELRLVFLLAPVAGVSLWTKGPDGQVACAVSFGEAEPTPGARAEARRVLSGFSLSRVGPGLIGAVPVLRWHRPYAALVVRSSRDDHERAVASAREAAAMLGAILEKETLLERSAAREKSLVESSERRLARLGFDLHDGALQDVAVLAGDVRLFREQLRGVLAEEEHRELLLGRVDDLEARLIALDGDLRSLARSFESPASAGRPLATVLQQEVATFGVRTDIAASLAVDGDFSFLTTSQRIALLRIVQEALSNIREHSGATAVRVSVVAEHGYVHAEIEDDGRGFDVEDTLVRAAQSGRLGLVGMSERARLLGGMLDVQSAPDGPTTVSLTLPEWRPVTAPAMTSEVEAEREPAVS